MNLPQWTAIREYVAAEINLAHARMRMLELRSRLNTNERGLGPQIAELSQLIKALEEQSTRMETAVRESLTEIGTAR